MRVTKEMIDPELRIPGAIMGRVFGGKKTIEELRNSDPWALKAMAYLPAFGLRKLQLELPRPDGSQLRAIVVTAKHPKPNAPAVLWLHGGGYSLGTPETELSAMRRFIKNFGCVCVSPDYRLSKEAPYPAALDDCYATLLWLKDNLTQLGARRDQIIIMGGSAGGGLTAATTLLARDKGEVQIAFQVPMYPMIEDRGTPSSCDNDAPVYDGITNESNWRLYLGPLYGGDVPAYAAPGRQTDFSNMPPTITFVGGVEPFRDETRAYVEKLRAANVPVEFKEYAGAWHAFDGIAPWTHFAKDANVWMLNRFREALGKYFAPQR